MKVAIAFLVFCGAMLSVDGACLASGCTLGSSLTGSAGCTTYKNYIDCLTTAKSQCTSSAADQAALLVIDPLITSNTALRTALKCSATGLAVSVTTLVLSALAAFFKL